MLEQLTGPLDENIKAIALNTKPTTVIYPTVNGLASNLTAANGSVGIRIVQDEFCKQLIQDFGKPIISTSANISGNDSPKEYNEIDQEHAGLLLLFALEKVSLPKVYFRMSLMVLEIISQSDTP